MVGPAEQPEKYTVDRLPEVTSQIRQFFEHAKQLGIGQEVLDVFELIVTQLETAPLEWGDPEYATKQEGSLALHAIEFPFIVRYVAFEKQRVVCMLKIRVLPGHPLEHA